MNRDIQLALAATWLIVSVITAATALAPWVVEESVLLRLAPTCEAASHGEACSLCGMSRAFIAIARGEWTEAHVLNAGSPWLYSVFVLNAAAAAIWCWRKRFSWKFSV